MNISGVLVGDVVLCDVLGRRFHAIVADEIDGEGKLPVEPIERNVTYRRVTARQVQTHWRKMGRPRSPKKVRG